MKKKYKYPDGGTPLPVNYGSLLLTAANAFNSMLKDKENKPIDFINQGLSDNSMTPSYSDYRGYADPNSGQIYARFGTEIPDLINTADPALPDFSSYIPQTSSTPESKSATPLNLDDKTALYLTHQQGVGGYKAIAKAAATGRPISDFYHGKENILSNMKGNVGSDYWNKYSEINAKNFIDYWQGKMAKAYKKASTKATPYDDIFNKVGGQLGLDSTFLKAVSFIESGGNANSNRNAGTQYKGLFQINKSELNKTGGTDIYNPLQNTYAAANIFVGNKRSLNMKEGGEYELSPEDIDFYTSQGYEFEEA